MSVRVVAAGPEHLEAVADIYGAEALSGIATFDLEPLLASSWTPRLASSSPGDHFLVALDDSGSVLGFAYSGTFRPRPAYRQTRETSIYLRSAARGQGLGTVLYAELLGLLRRDDMHVAIAAVAQPNPASNILHERLGFTLAGTLSEVGRKFGRWVDTRWYQLRLEP